MDWIRKRAESLYEQKLKIPLYDFKKVKELYYQELLNLYHCEVNRKSLLKSKIYFFKKDRPSHPGYQQGQTAEQYWASVRKWSEETGPCVMEMEVDALARKKIMEEDTVVPFPREGLEAEPKRDGGTIYMVLSVDTFGGKELRENVAPFSTRELAEEFIATQDWEYCIEYEIEEHIVDYWYYIR